MFIYNIYPPDATIILYYYYYFIYIIILFYLVLIITITITITRLLLNIYDNNKNVFCITAYHLPMLVISVVHVFVGGVL